MSSIRTRNRTQKSKYFENQSDSDLSPASSGDEFLPSKLTASLKSVKKSHAKRRKNKSTEDSSKLSKPIVYKSKQKSKNEANDLEYIGSDTTNDDDFEEVADNFSDNESKPLKLTSSRKSVRKSNTKRSKNKSTEDTSNTSKPTVSKSRRKIKNESNVLEDIEGDTTDDDDFEEVVDNFSDNESKSPVTTQREIEFMSQLFAKSEEKLPEGTEEEMKEIKVSISTVKTKSTIRDPEVLAAMAEARDLRQKTRSVHTFHVIAFLTLGRFINRLCDDPLIRALGLSLVKETKISNVSTLRSLVLSFMSLINKKLEVPILDMKEGIQKRLANRCSTADDCCILLVASLRALGFDTRLVLAFAPPPLKPQKCKTIKTLKPLSKGKSSDKIISSDSEDDITVESKYVFFAEVYLPSEKIWYSLDLTGPVGKVTAEFASSFHYPYVLGFSSTESSYLGRTPIDLAPRYDPSWMSTSRSNRISDAQYQKFLSSMRYYCDGDVCYLREVDNKRPEERRDVADRERTFDHLRSLPIPSRVQDFKNHPLYALRRHLLKFEVIYPDDAPVVGFLKVGAKGNEITEPVYPRECVHLCHTRESWLKEAKVVRVGEKPAKIVKAMMTMKRKLLQDQNGTEPTVELFGAWQVDDYVPPVAENGIVPRNEHGNVELFKASMLPIGCVHIRLPGIQYIAKQLEIDFAPAMVGWNFGKAGWAHPEYDGFVVCKEVLPALVDAWKAARMNAEAAEAAARSERALANWRKLTKHLLLWKRVEERFQLAKSAHVKPKLVALGDIKVPSVSSKPEPSTSDNPVYPRLLSVADLGKRTSKRAASAAKLNKTKASIASKRPRKQRRQPSTESESSESSESEDFMSPDPPKRSPKQPRITRQSQRAAKQGDDNPPKATSSSVSTRSVRRQAPAIEDQREKAGSFKPPAAYSGSDSEESESDDFLH